MPTRLRKLKITSVAVCPQGANYDTETGEGAHILLFKSADAEVGTDIAKADWESLSDSEKLSLFYDLCDRGLLRL